MKHQPLVPHAGQKIISLDKVLGMYDFPYPFKNSRNGYYSKYLYLIVVDILRTDFSFYNANVID